MNSAEYTNQGLTSDQARTMIGACSNSVAPPAFFDTAAGIIEHAHSLVEQAQVSADDLISRLGISGREKPLPSSDCDRACAGGKIDEMTEALNNLRNRAGRLNEAISFINSCL